MLLEMVRRDVATSSADLSDDAVLVRHVLQWLYKALDEDPRHLAPVLRTYLNTLFAASHEGGWHLDEWRRRDAGGGDETDALATFCRLVVAGEITPVDGLIDAVSKGWTWAESMLEMAELLANTSEGPVGNGLHLVFAPSPGKVIRYMVALPPTYNFMDHISGGDSRYSTCSSSKSHHHSATNTLKMRKATLRRATTTLPSLILQQTKGHGEATRNTQTLVSGGVKTVNTCLREYEGIKHLSQGV
ncbi:unnamed protein product [Timema podura]|uniref:Uncharacterized protein n=1 Tax=Timema podura TaxID=61482 RepID=A0ABN7PNV9_TIMPD|nr:unnamed protein product [Timema podura]